MHVCLAEKKFFWDVPVLANVLLVFLAIVWPRLGMAIVIENFYLLAILSFLSFRVFRFEFSSWKFICRKSHWRKRLITFKANMFSFTRATRRLLENQRDARVVLARVLEVERLLSRQALSRNGSGWCIMSVDAIVSKNDCCKAHLSV